MLILPILANTFCVPLRAINFRDATIRYYRAEYGIKNPTFYLPASKHIHRREIKIGQNLPEVTRRKNAFVKKVFVRIGVSVLRSPPSAELGMVLPLDHRMLQEPDLTGTTPSNLNLF